MRSADILQTSINFLIIPVEIAQNPALLPPGKRAENIK